MLRPALLLDPLSPLCLSLALGGGKGAGEEGQLGRNPLPSWNQAFLTLCISHSKANSFRDMRNPAKARPAMETAASTRSCSHESFWPFHQGAGRAQFQSVPERGHRGWGACLLQIRITQLLRQGRSMLARALHRAAPLCQLTPHFIMNHSQLMS